MTPPRYWPDAPLPPYAFLPGRDPHPTRDPRGHSYSEEEEAEVFPTPPEKWASCEPYLFGVDLYNEGYLWEAHEAWESLWHPCKPNAQQAEFLQGLIQCTAAALKVRMAQPRGVLRLGELGTGRLESVARQAGTPYMGLELLEFAQEFKRFAENDPEDAEDRPRIHLDT